jgi:hypothetical protein
LDFIFVILVKYNVIYGMNILLKKQQKILYPLCGKCYKKIKLKTIMIKLKFGVIIVYPKILAG